MLCYICEGAFNLRSLQAMVKPSLSDVIFDISIKHAKLCIRSYIVNELGSGMH